MIYYRCDSCDKKFTDKPPVVLKGITGTSGGILLPELYIRKHFCCPKCFWDWVTKYNPLTSEEKK